ncbi:MAG: hypothetical protein WC477_02795 [Patescibacteria group bacterium]
MDRFLWKFSIGFFMLITVLSTIFVACLRLGYLDRNGMFWFTDPEAEQLLFYVIFFGSAFSPGFMYTSPHLGIPIATCTASIIGLFIARDVFSGVNPIGTIVVYGGMFLFFSAVVAPDELGWIILGSIPFVFQAAVIGLTAGANHIWLPLLVYLLVCTLPILLFSYGLRWDAKKAPA